MKETMRTLQGHRAYSRTDNSDEFSLIPLPVGKAPAHASPPGGSTAPPPLTTAPLTCCGHRFPLLSRQDLSLDLLGPHPVSSLWDGILSHDPRDPVYLLCLPRDGHIPVFDKYSFVRAPRQPATCSLPQGRAQRVLELFHQHNYSEAVHVVGCAGRPL